MELSADVSEVEEEKKREGELKKCLSILKD
jgi:hypothetical protein